MGVTWCSSVGSLIQSKQEPGEEEGPGEGSGSGSGEGPGPWPGEEEEEEEEEQKETGLILSHDISFCQAASWYAHVLQPAHGLIIIAKIGFC